MNKKNNKIIKQGCRFNKLVVLEKAYETNFDTLWLCQCDCGLKLDVSSKALTFGLIKSCENCMNTKNNKKSKDNYTNITFGFLTVVSEIESKILKSGRKKRMFDCICSCGNRTIVPLCDLKSGKKISCGCREKTISRLKGIWRGIKVRTGLYNCKDKSIIKNYIERGITLCEEWENFSNFKEWSINNGYADTLTIDRINNNKGYNPDNCRWVSQRENSCNKRNNIKLNNGHSLCNLLWNLGITSGSKEYYKIIKYYKQNSRLPDKINNIIKEKQINLEEIL